MTEYRYTRHQVARGALADGRRDREVFLIKNVSTLGLTYQIKILVFMAAQEQRKLVLLVPKRTRVSDELSVFLEENAKHVRIEYDL